MSALDAPARLLDALDSEKIERELDYLWGEAIALQTAGTITDAQLRHLYAQEAGWGDDGTVPTRWVFSKFLRAQLSCPDRIGVNDPVGMTFPCRCGETPGWRLLEGGESAGWYPCPDCNPRLYEQWRSGCFKPNHTCEKCSPRRRSRAPGRSHADEVRQESSESRDEYVDAALFGDVGEAF